MPKKPDDSAAAPATLLVELLTEELPPRALQRLSEVFCETLVAELRRANLLAEGASAKAFATPRRLAVSLSRVLETAPDTPVEVTGPSVKAGLDAEGRPTAALAGFARKNGVAVADLVEIDTPKGRVFACRKIATGTSLDAILGGKVEEVLKRLPVPKKMRWGGGDAEFVRPVHGLMMLHGPRIVPGEVLGATSTNRTRGHRFLAQTPVVVRDADDYEARLRTEGHVIADFAARRAGIVAALERAAAGAKRVADEALLDEITSLVEFPAVYAGAFSADFLAVPQECLVLSMQQQQKYVPLTDGKTGALLPRFLFVSNLDTDQPADIIRGNERVLNARLADAKFFYEQDRKTRLEARVPRLAGVVYHGRLGTQLERVERLERLAGTLAQSLSIDPAPARRAARLAKADLLTEMVGEFPELQGTMGRYYALNDAEPAAVADAIEAHYRPRYAGDDLPATPNGAVVALADRLDALAGLFGIGQTPTGDRDPFGLRRAALGAIRILVEQDLPLSLSELIGAAFAGFDGKIGDARADLQGFILERLSGYLRERGYSALEVDSVMSLHPVQVNLVPRQLEAVQAFTRLPEAQSLAAANKRVVNILRQAEAKGESLARPGPDALREPAERALFEALQQASRHATPLYDQGDYTGYLRAFSVLKAPVDAFFDSVMVMADDPSVRRNRLALLSALRDEMNRVADISKLAA
jgi:glycyl-tRNA synthetase beta chain